MLYQLSHGRPGLYAAALGLSFLVIGMLATAGAKLWHLDFVLLALLITSIAVILTLALATHEHQNTSVSHTVLFA